MSCEAERLICCTAEDSCSAAEATNSALLATSLEFFRSSVSSDRVWAVLSHSARALDCSATVLADSSAAEDCTSPAAAIASAPFTACLAATLDWEAPVAISRMPLPISMASRRICSICTVMILPFCTSCSTVRAAEPMPSAMALTSCWIWPTRSWISLALFSEVSARVLTSSATTAKPLPCLPARAASMAALSASRLV